VASTGKAELRAELKVEQEQGQMGQILALKDEQLYKSLAHNQLLRQKVQDLEKRTDKLEMDAHYWKKKSDESKQEAEEVVLNHKLIENNFEKEKDEYKHKLMVLEEKVKYWEQKFHEQKLKNSELSSKQHMDHKSIKRREDELEERLSLLHSDSGMQIQVREKKIMELKRKVDLLDFDLQESVLRESEMKERIKELEKKLEHSVSTLRSLFRELEIKPSSTLQMRDVSLLKKVD
jgi:chromosome segregation ATPase